MIRPLLRALATMTAGALTVLTAAPASAHHNTLHFGTAGDIGSYYIRDIVASPAFATDRTVFAMGWSPGQCAIVVTYTGCDTLFTSTDGGTTWTLVDSEGLLTFGGTILLPPSYPADDRIFVGGSEGLYVSGDGGATFALAAPGLAANAAMSPGFDTTDPRIVFGASRALAYNDHTGLVEPLGKVVTSSGITQFHFAPDYLSTGELLVSGTVADAGSQRTAVFACGAGPLCPERWRSDVAIGPADFALSPSYATDGTLYGWRARRMFRSTDRGHSFVNLTSPVADGQVSQIAVSATGVVYAAMSPTLPSGVMGLFRSTDGGASWTQLDPSGPLGTNGAALIEVLPDRLLAVPGLGSPAGVLCSTDDGASWAPAC
jgi:hypothetical protein